MARVKFANLILSISAVTMRSSLLLIIAVTAVSAFPSQPTQEEVRASLITKHNFRLRQQKGLATRPLSVPKPMVVTTSLDVRDSSNARRGRTWMDKDGATVVEGVRMPDDESDR